ncbi:hypothetical protein RB195_003531 [Necator americanus]|uniref:Uncharacterized protein n=1 Tax=Necator americanus TaxID=51031 RepID=A0ABR1DP02_NECAM
MRAGPYNGFREIADVSIQSFHGPRQVWYQFIDPGGMKGSVGNGAVLNHRSCGPGGPLTDWATPAPVPDQGDTRTTRHGDCPRLCTHSVSTVSTDADLNALLGSEERIKFHAIALLEIRSRRSDMDDGERHVEEDSSGNYDKLAEDWELVLNVTAKELLERRKKLRLDPNPLHIERMEESQNSRTPRGPFLTIENVTERTFDHIKLPYDMLQGA